MAETVEIRHFQPGDWPAVQEIYQQGIDTGHATFQPKAKDWAEWDSSALPECRLVAVAGEEVVGWAALSRVSSRPVYAGVAEVSIYVATAQQGRGIGRQLLTTLVTESERAGFWTLQAGIFPENRASMELHQKCGFRIVGVRQKLGQMHGQWRDVLLLERRSQNVGI
jgi:phosphinothricin acetyltransferase